MTRNRGRATLADVARLAGVSLGSASRALSVPDKVKPSTLQKVREAVLRLGYIRDGSARALASRRTRTIGAIYPTLNNPIFAHSTHSMQQTLWSLGYQLLIASHEYHIDDELAVIQATMERGVDGIIMVGTDHSETVFGLLAQYRMPYVLTWSTDDSSYPHCVGISNFQAAFDLGRAVMDVGHRKIAVCGGEVSRNERARGRRNGLIAAMVERGLNIRDEWRVIAAFSYQGGRDGFRRLWEQPERPTAIVFGTDLQAIGALYEARRMGLSVPDDVSILGFDGIEEGQLMQPSLATVELPAHEIGRLAALRMVALLEEESLEPAMPLAHALRLGDSLGPPPAS